MRDSTETIAVGDPHFTEGRRGPTWRGWVLSILMAVILWLCTLAMATIARAEGPPRPVGYYVDAALSGYPSLASMRQRITMKRNEAIRAGALDDPKGWIAISNVPVRNWSFREEDMTGKEIGLSQMIPYPGKRAHAARIVEKEKEQAEFELAEMRNMLRADVKMAYAELSTVRAQAEVVRQLRAVLDQVVQVSTDMFAVGKGSQPDVLRGQVEFQKMREMLLMLENREKVLSIRLNTIAALPASAPVPALDNLAEFSPRVQRGGSPGDLQGGASGAASRPGADRERDPGGPSRRARVQAGLRGLHLLHAAGRDARRDEALGHVLRHGVDDPSDLEERENRARNPCDDGGEGDGDSRRGDPGRRGGQHD